MVTYAAAALRQTMWGMAPKLEGSVFAAQDVNQRGPMKNPGPDGKTFDDWNPAFVADFYNQSATVSPWEMQSGETGRGLLTGKFPVDTAKDGRQWREVEQLGSGVAQGPGGLIAASSWTNNTADRKPPNYYHAALRPRGVAAWRNGHGTYNIHNGQAWATSASVFLARDNTLKAVYGNPSSPQELGARVYASQYGARPASVDYSGNAIVAQGPQGTAHIVGLGFHSADELLAVVFGNIHPGSHGPVVPGLVRLAGDKNIPSSPQGLAVAVGRDGQWIFDYLSMLAWGGMETAVPRFYAKLDEVVASATGNVG